MAMLDFYPVPSFVQRRLTGAVCNGWACMAHERETPQAEPGGRTESRFSGVYRVKAVGLAVEGIRRMTLVFRASAAHRSISSPAGQEKDDDV
jgi:hypothetical protein